MGIFALGLTLYAGQTVRPASVTLRGLSAKTCGDGRRKSVPGDEQEEENCRSETVKISFAKFLKLG